MSVSSIEIYHPSSKLKPLQNVRQLIMCHGTKLDESTPHYTRALQNKHNTPIASEKYKINGGKFQMPIADSMYILMDWR